MAYYNEPKTFQDRAKRSLSVGLLAIVAFTVTSIADHYLGIYAWTMASIAVLDRFFGVTTSKDLYMSLALIALVALVVIKLSRTGGREMVYWKARRKNR